MVQQVDTFAAGDSIEVTAVYIGGWWMLPLGLVILVAGLGALWWVRHRRRRRMAP